MMETVGSSKLLVHIYWTKWCHILKDHNLQTIIYVHYWIIKTYYHTRNEMIFRTVKNHTVFLGVHKIEKCNLELFVYVLLSIHLPIWNNSVPNGHIFMKFSNDYFQKSIRKLKPWLKYDKNNGYIYENVSLNSSWNDVSDLSCWDNHNTHFMFNNFFWSDAICEIRWRNTVQPNKKQMMICGTEEL